MREGDNRNEYKLLDDGRVARRLISTFNGSDVVRMEKILAESLDEFRERYPGIRISNVQDVPAQKQESLKSKLERMTDEELAEAGLQRARAGDEAKLAKDFPGDFALKRALGLDVTMGEVRGMTKEQLRAIEGIGAALADKIIAAR